MKLLGIILLLFLVGPPIACALGGIWGMYAYIVSIGVAALIFGH